MGRPLYSSISTAAATSAPTPPDVTIRTVPDAVPDVPEVHKWSYWNAFDPDADDFFNGPNAVYEAFVDPSSLPPLREEIALEEAGDVMTVLGRAGQMERWPSPLSTEDGTSGRTTRSPYPFESDEDSEDEVITASDASLPSRPVIRRVLTPVLVPEEVEEDRPITPPPRPNTPPAVANPILYTPSPPPTVTPRLFTWAPRNVIPASPLPNRSARMSVGHLSPTAYVRPVIVNRIRG
ncbi:hypothetical protein EUX98_g4098 [Antrodiella citrinella]|uniref:Uncharacterized protein n=1 Tax=Antrodiella citrinella TaxID=2447956 RepID=A0A4S4MWY6_9APHY|nr:hypothetical protein EUX98_g4098 [Antrodiella citrinella]